MEYLENQSRRNNIRVSGIPESPGETWTDSENKVKEAIKSSLVLDIEIERPHRVDKRKKVGGKQQSKEEKEKPRTIVWKLKDWKQRESVIRRRGKESKTKRFRHSGRSCKVNPTQEGGTDRGDEKGERCWQESVFHSGSFDNKR